MQICVGPINFVPAFAVEQDLAANDLKMFVDFRLGDEHSLGVVRGFDLRQRHGGVHGATPVPIVALPR